MKLWQVRHQASQIVGHIKLSAQALKLAEEAHLSFCYAALCHPEVPEAVRKEQARVMNILRSLGARFIGIGEVLQGTDSATIESKIAGLIKECEIALKTLQANSLHEQIEEMRERRKDENAGQ